MNIRRLSYGLLLTLATTLAACGGGETPVEGAPQPSGTPATDVAPAPGVSGAAEATPPPNTSPSGTGAAVAPTAPPAKPAKEKWVGKFSQQLAGEVKEAWETENKAKFAKEKDTKKHDEAAKKKEGELAEVVIDNTGDTHTFSVKGKATHKIKFEAGKGDDKSLTIKLGQDETAKKDLKGAELTITFIDENTFELTDPYAKDPKKAQKLVFKRQ
jgi:type IV secretory pathway VirB10-like protein